MSDIPIFGIKHALHVTLYGKDGCIVGELEGWALSDYETPELIDVRLVGNGPDGLGESVYAPHSSYFDGIDMPFYKHHLVKEAEKPEELQELADKWWEWRKDQIARADVEVNAMKEAALWS